MAQTSNIISIVAQTLILNSFHSKEPKTEITITIFELISGEAASQPCPGWQDGAHWAWAGAGR